MLEGTVTFWTDTGSLEAGPGTFVHVPKGALHHFRNESTTSARMLIWFAPAGIEEMFAELHQDPERRIEIATAYGVVFPAGVGRARTLTPAHPSGLQAPTLHRGLSPTNE